ncbi:LysM peptidoglycan-binding domain-containing protein [Microbacterium sediminis]|nr:LysM peptidoglycan-binding domain-containing protein [Microbacterium sediminis]
MLATAPVAVIGSIASALCATPAHAAEDHTVQPGDTVTRIAIRNGLQTADVLSWNGLTPRATIYPGQKLRLAAPTAAPAAPTPASTSPGAVHTVAAGDTIWGISRQHGTTVEAILAANGLKASAVIYPGQKLKLGGAAPQAAPAAAAPAPAAAPAAAPQAAPATHEVKPGDTLWGIAHQHGKTVSELLKANGLGAGAIIYPGQKLKLSAPKPAPAATGANVQKWASLTAEQTANARLIIGVGREIGASDRAIATALATAMVESSLRNVAYGDRDSLGLFQQRPSYGWGTPEQILDPVRATKVFFGGATDPNGGTTRGLFDIAGWEKKSFGDAAQAVQISAFPERYGQWEKQSYAWLASLG